MSIQNTAVLACLAATLSLASSAAAATDTDDPILASFEREFRHAVVDAEVVTGSAIDEDILYRLINLPLRGSQHTEDAVRQSFRREFTHQVVDVEVPTGQAVEKDVLYRLVSEALRD